MLIIFRVINPDLYVHAFTGFIYIHIWYVNHNKCNTTLIIFRAINPD